MTRLGPLGMELRRGHTWARGALTTGQLCTRRGLPDDIKGCTSPVGWIIVAITLCGVKVITCATSPRIWSSRGLLLGWGESGMDIGRRCSIMLGSRRVVPTRLSTAGRIGITSIVIWGLIWPAIVRGWLGHRCLQ